MIPRILEAYATDKAIILIVEEVCPMTGFRTRIRNEYVVATGKVITKKLGPA